MHRLRADQYPAIAHIVRDETEFPSVSLAFQRREGEFWVDRVEAPAVVIGLLPKDTFVWGDLCIDGVKTLLARASGPVADSPGLEPLLQEVWDRPTRIPSVEYRVDSLQPNQPALPAGFRLFAVGREHLELLCRYRHSYRSRGTIGDFRSYDDFFEHGFGSTAVDDLAGEIVPACMAHAVSARRVDTPCVRWAVTAVEDWPQPALVPLSMKESCGDWNRCGSPRRATGLSRNREEDRHEADRRVPAV